MTVGMDLITVPGATGDYHTNFDAKAQACIQHIRQDYDFGFCHLKAVDDAGHDKDVEKKVYYLEKMDAMIGSVMTALRDDDTDVKKKKSLSYCTHTDSLSCSIRLL